jgi:molybdenum cofactor cytidylyltransferase
MGKICAIVLAAGESLRMGIPKMLLPFEGDTMIGKVLNSIEQSEVDERILVLGANREIISDAVRDHELITCINYNYKDGMLSSVVAGIGAVPAGIEAVIVFQGDQPLITAETINLIINTFRKCGKGIVVPVVSCKRGHPLLISSGYFDIIRDLDKNVGLRSLLELYSDDIFEVRSDDKGVLIDFDTPQEYREFIGRRNI